MACRTGRRERAAQGRWLGKRHAEARRQNHSHWPAEQGRLIRHESFPRKQNHNDGHRQGYPQQLQERAMTVLIGDGGCRTLCEFQGVRGWIQQRPGMWRRTIRKSAPLQNPQGCGTRHRMNSALLLLPGFHETFLHMSEFALQRPFTEAGMKLRRKFYWPVYPS